MSKAGGSEVAESALAKDAAAQVQGLSLQVHPPSTRSPRCAKNVPAAKWPFATRSTSIVYGRVFGLAALCVSKS